MGRLNGEDDDHLAACTESEWTNHTNNQAYILLRSPTAIICASKMESFLEMLERALDMHFCALTRLPPTGVEEAIALFSQSTADRKIATPELAIVIAASKYNWINNRYNLLAEKSKLKIFGMRKDDIVKPVLRYSALHLQLIIPTLVVRFGWQQPQLTTPSAHELRLNWLQCNSIRQFLVTKRPSHPLTELMRDVFKYRYSLIVMPVDIEQTCFNHCVCCWARQVFAAAAATATRDSSIMNLLSFLMSDGGDDGGGNGGAGDGRCIVFGFRDIIRRFEL